MENHSQLGIVHTVGSRSVGELLDAKAAAFEPEPSLWGFNGLHGGLTLGLLTASMAGQVESSAELVSVSGHFHRSIRNPISLTPVVTRAGRSATTVQATANEDGQTLASAIAVFGNREALDAPRVVPEPPTAGSPGRYHVFTVPPQFVPIAPRTEIRPVGPNLPYSGAAEPELTAWIRFVDEDRAPDALRLIFLADALAPSYAAVLTEIRQIPTIELVVTLGGGVAVSPWVLLHARTELATVNGWITERIDLWDEAGTHLATARQLRLLA